MKNLFSPAIYLMNSLKYPRKFALIGALLGITILTMLYLIISEINIGVEFAKKERLGLEYLRPLKKVSQDLIQYRITSFFELRSNISPQTDSSSLQVQTDANIKTMNVVDAKLGGILQSTAKWQPIQAKWELLQRNHSLNQFMEIAADYRSISQDLHYLNTHIGDTSNLILDPDLDTFYLMDLAINKIPSLTEAITLLFENSIAEVAHTPQSRTRQADIATRLSEIRTDLIEINNDIDKIYRANPALSNTLASLVEANRLAIKVFLKDCDALLKNTANSATLTPKEHFVHTLATQETSDRLLDGVIISLDRGLEKRIERFTFKKFFISFLVLVIATIVIYLFIGFYLAVVNTVTQIETTLAKIKGGDLSARANPATKDELKVVAQGLNEMASELSLNIAHRERALQEIFRQKELAEITLHSIGDGVITTDAAGYIEYMNPAAEELTGISRSNAEGLALKEVFYTCEIPTDQPLEDPVSNCLKEDRVIDFGEPRILISANGRKFTIESFGAPIKDRQGHTIGAVLVFHDISSSHEMAQRLSWQATHDPLTGLLNRRGFETRLNQLLAHVSDNNPWHSILYIDLDHFKQVNDSWGHDAGDELLTQLTRILQTRIRGNDVFARLGGDEFAVLLENCTSEAAMALANTLLTATKNFEFKWDEHIFRIGISIGIASVQSGVDNLSSTLKAADTACYAAKRAGRNCIRLAA